jgi:hypothetical protein
VTAAARRSSSSTGFFVVSIPIARLNPSLGLPFWIVIFPVELLIGKYLRPGDTGTS